MYLYLRSLGYDVWIDKRNISGVINESVGDALAETDVLLCLCTAQFFDTLQSPWPQRELYTILHRPSLDRARQLLPVVRECDFPGSFERGGGATLKDAGKSVYVNGYVHDRPIGSALSNILYSQTRFGARPLEEFTRDSLESIAQEVHQRVQHSLADGKPALSTRSLTDEQWLAFQDILHGGVYRCYHQGDNTMRSAMEETIQRLSHKVQHPDGLESLDVPCRPLWTGGSEAVVYIRTIAEVFIYTVVSGTIQTGLIADRARINVLCWRVLGLEGVKLVNLFPLAQGTGRASRGMAAPSPQLVLVFVAPTLAAGQLHGAVKERVGKDGTVYTEDEFEQHILGRYLDSNSVPDNSFTLALIRGDIVWHKDTPQTTDDQFGFLGVRELAKTWIDSLTHLTSSDPESLAMHITAFRREARGGFAEIHVDDDAQLRREAASGHLVQLFLRPVRHAAAQAQMVHQTHPHVKGVDVLPTIVKLLQRRHIVSVTMSSSEMWEIVVECIAEPPSPPSATSQSRTDGPVSSVQSTLVTTGTPSGLPSTSTAAHSTQHLRNQPGSPPSTSSNPRRTRQSTPQSLKGSSSSLQVSAKENPKLAAAPPPDVGAAATVAEHEKAGERVLDCGKPQLAGPSLPAVCNTSVPGQHAERLANQSSLRGEIAVSHSNDNDKTPAPRHDPAASPSFIKVSQAPAQAKEPRQVLGSTGKGRKEPGPAFSPTGERPGSLLESDASGEGLFSKAEARPPAKHPVPARSEVHHDTPDSMNGGTLPAVEDSNVASVSAGENPEPAACTDRLIPAKSSSAAATKSTSNTIVSPRPTPRPQSPSSSQPPKRAQEASSPPLPTSVVSAFPTEPRAARAPSRSGLYVGSSKLVGVQEEEGEGGDDVTLLEDGLRDLQAMTGAFYPMAVFGKGRIGKSWFCNFLAHKLGGESVVDDNPFQVRGGSDACTSGVDFLPSALRCPCGRRDCKRQVLLMDLEGTGHEGHDHDVRIMTPTVFACAVTFYHTREVKKAHVLKDLEVLSETARLLQRSHDGPQTAGHLWIVLRDTDGSSKEWSTRILSADGNKERDAVRRSLRRLYKSVNCCVLPRSISDVDRRAGKTSWRASTEEWNRAVTFLLREVGTQLHNPHPPPVATADLGYLWQHVLATGAPAFDHQMATTLLACRQALENASEALEDKLRAMVVQWSDEALEQLLDSWTTVAKTDFENGVVNCSHVAIKDQHRAILTAKLDKRRRFAREKTRGLRFDSVRATCETACRLLAAHIKERRVQLPPDYAETKITVVCRNAVTEERRAALPDAQWKECVQAGANIIVRQVVVSTGHSPSFLNARDGLEQARSAQSNGFSIRSLGILQKTHIPFEDVDLLVAYIRALWACCFQDYDQRPITLARFGHFLFGDALATHDGDHDIWILLMKDAASRKDLESVNTFFNKMVAHFGQRSLAYPDILAQRASLMYRSWPHEWDQVVVLFEEAINHEYTAHDVFFRYLSAIAERASTGRDCNRCAVLFKQVCDHATRQARKNNTMIETALGCASATLHLLKLSADLRVNADMKQFAMVAFDKLAQSTLGRSGNTFCGPFFAEAALLLYQWYGEAEGARSERFMRIAQDVNCMAGKQHETASAKTNLAQYMDERYRDARRDEVRRLYKDAVMSVEIRQDDLMRCKAFFELDDSGSLSEAEMERVRRDIQSAF